LLLDKDSYCTIPSGG
jgi:hypothetical protein